jgi:hypothetical protein
MLNVSSKIIPVNGFNFYLLKDITLHNSDDSFCLNSKIFSGRDVQTFCSSMTGQKL